MKKTATILLILIHLQNTQKCPSSDTLCLSCSDQICNVCINSFINEFGKCEKPEKTIKNCLNYKNNENCSICQHGYFLKKNTCQKIVEKNCLEKNEEKCSLCKNRILIKNGICENKNKCFSENCELCIFEENEERCIVCEKGFVLRSGEGGAFCVEEDDKLKNCLYELDLENCAICDMGYYFSNGECVLSGDMVFEEYVDIGVLGFFVLWAFV